MRLAEILEQFQHDRVNRFLLRATDTPKALFEEVKGALNLVGGTASGDDSVIDPPDRSPGQSAFGADFYSGTPKRTGKGMNLMTLYSTDMSGNSSPVNFRLDDKREGTTKHEDCRDMRRDVPAWGLQPSWVTGESWYASVDNLKFLRNEEVGGWFGIADNRKVSVEPGTQVQVPTLEIPDPGLVVYRNALGWVKVVCQNFKPEVRDDLMDLPD